MAPESRRLQLHELLTSLAGDAKVYYQPPENLKMTYPCVRYQRDSENATFADNRPWRRLKRYQITVIAPKPDNPLLAALEELPSCVFERHYTADNLNHDVYNIFF